MALVMTKGAITQRKWKQRHPDRSAANVARAERLYHILVDGLKNAPCLDCGGRFPPECMDFDHVRGEKKLNVGNMKRYSHAIVLAEIAKCELVCSNCHRIRTRRRRV